MGRRNGAAPPLTPTPPSGGSPFALRFGLAEECAQHLWTEEGAAVLAYARSVRRLPDAVLRDLGLGALVVQSWAYLTVPVRSARGDEVLDMRFRSVPGPCPLCAGAGCEDARCDGGKVRKAYLHCPGAPLALYGLDLLPDDPGARVVVCEGELDVAALRAYGLERGVASGTGGAGCWREEWTDQLESYRHVVLAYDADKPGDEGAEKVAAALGRYRCSRAKPPRGHKDWGDALAAGIPAEEVHAALDRAQSCLQVRAVQPSELARGLADLTADPAKLRGLPAATPRLTRAVGGWRPELWVVTGDTGAGKTTWACWELVEQARRGHAVLLTAFEQREAILAKLLRMELGGDLVGVSSERRSAAMAELDALPLRVLNHYGTLDPALLVDALRYEVRRRRCRFALIDHLGFLVDPGAEDERRMLDAVVRALVGVCCSPDGPLTVFLVVHPNRLNVQQRRRVTMRDLKGASSLEQDAGGVLVVERLLPAKGRPHPWTRIHVDKVRSEWGDPGAEVEVCYDRAACRFLDAPPALCGADRAAGVEREMEA